MQCRLGIRRGRRSLRRLRHRWRVRRGVFLGLAFELLVSEEGSCVERRSSARRGEGGDGGGGLKVLANS